MIIPSILAKDRQDLKQILRKYKSIEGPFHIDIGDNQFVPNATIGLEEVEENLDKDFYVHLMVNKPEDIISFWLELENLRGVVFHIESTKSPEELISKIKFANKEVFVGMKPDTSIDSLDPLLPLVDGVHFMTVSPGFYGSEFIEAMVPRIKEFHLKHPNVVIQVDGGVNLETIEGLREAGASRFIVGSFILNSVNVGKAIEELQSKV